MLIKRSIFGPLKQRINQDITSYFPDQITQVHVVWYSLNAAPNHLHQVLKDQCQQIDLVTGLDVVHKPAVNLAYRRMFRSYELEEM